MVPSSFGNMTLENCCNSVFAKADVCTNSKERFNNNTKNKYFYYYML